MVKALKLHPLLNALISESSWLQGITTGPGAAPTGGPWLLPLELWVAPSPHCYCCCYHHMTYWRLGYKRMKKKRQRKENRCLLFCLSPFSWSSRQNQRAFPGTLFVDANTHFMILHCIGFSPGDIGGLKIINLLLICVTLISGLL